MPIRKSLAEDFIICLEDGKKFKLLRRHLMAKYGLTPEQYRRKWGLPADYPMIAPSYARQRSKLAASRWSRTGADVLPSTVRTGPPISAIMEPAWPLQELF
ncbi:transcriptional regulator (plasmid) [Sinorhizobium alkalisoli]|nr:transcriptional regulator [Sinorhizobium alkalisoli]